MEELYLDDYVQNAQGNFIATLSNGKEVFVNGKEINQFVTKGKMKEIDAIEMWLDDNGHLENSEQLEFIEKTKNYKVNHETGAKKRKQTKPRTVKVSDDKKQLFSEIYENLYDVYRENVQIIKENKLISVQIGEKTFKIDIIEQRNKKK